MNTEIQKEYTLDEIVEKTFDFSGYPEDQHQTMIQETSGMLMESSLMKVLEASDESQQESFNSFVDTNPDQESMMKYILDNFPNFQMVLVEEIQGLKELGSKN